jgi:hypothetical protein
MKRALIAVSFVLALSLTTPAFAHTVLFRGVTNSARERPATLWLSVDGTIDAFHMHWRTWGSTVAVGNGRIDWHGCTPNCGSDKPHEAAGRVHLSQIHYCEGQAYYSKVSAYVEDRGAFRLLYGLVTNYAPC